jgi:hypothetical protein
MRSFLRTGAMVKSNDDSSPGNSQPDLMCGSLPGSFLKILHAVAALLCLIALSAISAKVDLKRTCSGLYLDSGAWDTCRLELVPLVFPSNEPETCPRKSSCLLFPDYHDRDEALPRARRDAAICQNSLVIAFLVITMVAHLGYLLLLCCRQTPTVEQMQAGRFPWRWVEFAVTAPLVFTVIALQVGVVRVWTLVTLWGLTFGTMGFLYLADVISGYAYELKRKLNLNSELASHDSVSSPSPSRYGVAVAVGMGGLCHYLAWVVVFGQYHLLSQPFSGEIRAGVTFVMVFEFVLCQLFAVAFIVKETCGGNVACGFEVSVVALSLISKITLAFVLLYDIFPSVVVCEGL